MKGFLAACSLSLLLGLAQTLDSAEAQGGARPVPAPVTPEAAPRDRTQPAYPKGDEQATPGYVGADAAFFKDGTSAGLAEVAAAELALQRASDPRVKQFAQQMARDHGQANQELAALARQKGVAPPEAPNAKQQQALEALKARQGPAFDQAYLGTELADHRDAVSLFELAERSTDPQVSAFARKTLPLLRHHLQMVEDLQRG